MNSSTPTTPPIWFSIVAGLALVWNLIGIAAYFAQMNMDLGDLPAAQQAFYGSIPLWATAAFTIAVFAGTAGCLGLLLKKTWAIPLLVLSCIGVLVQMTHSFLVGDGLAVFGASALGLPLATLAISLALIWFARSAKNKGWIQS